MIDARELARVAVLWAWSFCRGDLTTGYAPRGEPRVGTGGYTRNGTDASLTVLATRLEAPMGTPPAPTVPLFVELCAGTAALSLALHGGRHARPPVSRMGSKAGYAGVILATLGLRPGQGAGRYLWCEPDDGCRLMLIAYTSAAIRREAAAVIRGWADEEPRALWTRLRDEGPVRGCPAAWSGGEVDPREVARWAVRASWNYATGSDREGYAGPGSGSHPQGLAGIGGALGVLPDLPATITSDARTVDPREVARWVWLGVKSYCQGILSSGGPVDRYTSPSSAAGVLDVVPDLPAAIVDDARDVEPAQLPPGTIAYLDPPYVGTTGYASDLPRADVVALARRWAAAGAWVVISEAEPIADLVADGWHAVEITAGRVGQKRTFSRQQREWLTMSRAPVWRPSEQVGLFG